MQMPRGRKPANAQPIIPMEEFTPRPALTPEARENSIISAAYDLAEKQIREGTASSQVITHFLRLGSEKEKLERALLEERTKLASAKTEAIDRDKEQTEVYYRALKAMQIYNGEPVEDCDDVGF